MRTVQNTQTEEGQQGADRPVDRTQAYTNSSEKSYRGSVQARNVMGFVFWKGHSSSKVEGEFGKAGRMTPFSYDSCTRQAALVANLVLQVRFIVRGKYISFKFLLLEFLLRSDILMSICHIVRLCGTCLL